MLNLLTHLKIPTHCDSFQSPERHLDDYINIAFLFSLSCLYNTSFPCWIPLWSLIWPVSPAEFHYEVWYDQFPLLNSTMKFDMTSFPCWIPLWSLIWPVSPAEFHYEVWYDQFPLLNSTMKFDMTSFPAEFHYEVWYDQFPLLNSTTKFDMTSFPCWIPLWSLIWPVSPAEFHSEVCPVYRDPQIVLLNWIEWSLFELACSTISPSRVFILLIVLMFWLHGTPPDLWESLDFK